MLDKDGNETAGVRSVHLRVPLGTYTGWNIETRGVDAGKHCGFEEKTKPWSKGDTADDQITICNVPLINQEAVTIESMPRLAQFQ